MLPFSWSKNVNVYEEVMTSIEIVQKPSLWCAGVVHYFIINLFVSHVYSSRFDLWQTAENIYLMYMKVKWHFNNI